MIRRLALAACAATLLLAAPAAAEVVQIDPSHNGVSFAYGPSGVAPVTGTFGATGQSAALLPNPGRLFNVTLTGTFSATVQLERSFDSGATWVPLTAAGSPIYVWTAASSESAYEAETGVKYRLNCTGYASGTVTYRISQ